MNPAHAGVAVLIVDDNPTNLKLLSYVLSSQGYDVQTAGDAISALAALKERRPQVILMDLQLPGMDGLELSRRLKMDPATRDIVILAVTAYAMKGDEQRARAAGCDGYVAKPIDTRTFPALVASYLARAPETQ